MKLAPKQRAAARLTQSDFNEAFLQAVDRGRIKTAVLLADKVSKFHLEDAFLGLVMNGQTRAVGLLAKKVRQSTLNQALFAIPSPKRDNLLKEFMEPNMILALIRAGADPDARDPIDDMPFLFKAVSYPYSTRTKMVKALIDAGVKLNVRGAENESILYSAIDHPEIATLRLLLKAGARIPGRGEESPLSEAIRTGYLESARILFNYGARFGKDEYDLLKERKKDPRAAPLLKQATKVVPWHWQF